MAKTQPPRTTGWPPPSMAKDHLTFKRDTFCAVRPKWGWNRLEAPSKPDRGQLEALAFKVVPAGQSLSIVPGLEGAGIIKLLRLSDLPDWADWADWADAVR